MLFGTFLYNNSSPLRNEQDSQIDCRTICSFVDSNAQSSMQSIPKLGPRVIAPNEEQKVQYVRSYSGATSQHTINTVQKWPTSNEETPFQ